MTTNAKEITDVRDKEKNIQDEILEPILLIYENQDRLQYYYLSEFFNLLGFWVYEELTKNIASYVEEKQEFLYSYKIQKLDAASNFEEICKMFEVSDQGWLKEMYKIYTAYNLPEHIITLQNYRMNHKQVEKTGEKFFKTVIAIEDMIKKYPEYSKCPHIRYAKLYCKQKANLARFLCNKPVYYYVDVLQEEGLNLTRDNARFAKAWFLLGRIYESDKEYVKDALDAFHRAIKMTEENPYSSEIYYWLAIKCEERSSLQDSKDGYFLKSFNLLPGYKNAYKLADSYIEKHEWEHAKEWLFKCLKYIEERTSYLTPLEQEYYFKIKVDIGYCYLQTNDYYNTIVNCKKALEFVNKIEEKEDEYVKFYFDVYGENADIYIDMTLKRMGKRNVYRYLAIAYAESDMEETSERYWKMYKNV